MISYKMPYANLKALIASKGLAWQYVDSDTIYFVFAVEAGLHYEAMIYKSPITVGGIDAEAEAVSQADFETNFKPTANQRLGQIDSDGATMSRTKVAPSGWNFNLRGVEFSTSTLDSVVNRDAYDTGISDVALKLYKADGTLITDQGVADADCVKTQIDIEPPYDIYISGGKLKFITQPNVDVRVGVIGVPDVPANMGGSKQFVQNVNLKFLPASEGVNADGRAAKWLQYNATYHTNKIRFILYHPAGHKMPIEVLQETYRQ